MAEDLDDEALAFAHRMLDLARRGDADTLAGFVDARLPVDLRNGKGDTLLILAAYNDHPETVRVLLERGADTAVVNDRGQTALAAAVLRQSDEEVDVALQRGADPALGSPSAVEVARLFALPAMVARLGVGACGQPR